MKGDNLIRSMRPSWWMNKVNPCTTTKSSSTSNITLQIASRFIRTQQIRLSLEVAKFSLILRSRLVITTTSKLVGTGFGCQTQTLTLFSQSKESNEEQVDQEVCSTHPWASISRTVILTRTHQQGTNRLVAEKCQQEIAKTRRETTSWCSRSSRTKESSSASTTTNSWAVKWSRNHKEATRECPETISQRSHIRRWIMFRTLGSRNQPSKRRPQGIV